MDHEHEAEHFPKVTTDETAAATDTGAFLKALKEKEGGARQADEDGPSLVRNF